MGAQHTAGPWIVEPINDGLTYQVTTAEGDGFTVICETPGGDDADKANAQLICAAPDLLAALVKAKQALWIGARDQWTMADFKNWAVIQKIDAVLSKARGETL